MKHLKEVDMDHLREALLAREAALTAEVDDSLREQREQAPAGREVDSAVFDLSTALGFAEVLRDQQELDAVRGALARMDRGTFGRCLSCGARIPIDRLRAQPSAEYCHVCQSRAEEDGMAVPPAP
jgi:RNA polymerase-binding protein DksA